jgi:hypothetical protein
MAKPGCRVFKYFRSNTIITGKELVLCCRCRVYLYIFRNAAGLFLARIGWLQGSPGVIVIIPALLTPEIRPSFHRAEVRDHGEV